ncbi:hypothetical protein [Teredinibacter turnerae]|uniref:hypothetical protein n=1 Tax=Teredinibacter turnerae TaxID=2426 RepID=UPI0003708CF7|nr:hypothetical protein [Teredinibacter turnerae]
MKYTVGILGLVLSVSAYAEPPKILTNAMDAYMEKGRSAFLPAMLKGSPLENEKSVLVQENMIGQVESYYGKPESWEVLAECDLTERFRSTYYIVYYEKGPVFGYVDTYKLKSGFEIAAKFQFHTEAAQILPFKPIAKEKICGA